MKYYIEDSHYNKNSIKFCWFMVLFIFMFTSFTLIMYGHYFKVEEIEKNFKMREFFSGLKDSSSTRHHRSILSSTVVIRSKLLKNIRKARIFTFIFLLRRLLLTIMIVTLDTLFAVVYRVS